MGYRSNLEAKLARKTTRAIKVFNLIEDGDRIMIGLSGGKDSWALMEILDVLRRRAPRTDQVFAYRSECGLGVLGL